MLNTPYASFFIGSTRILNMDSVVFSPQRLRYRISFANGRYQNFSPKQGSRSNFAILSPTANAKDVLGRLASQPSPTSTIVLHKGIISRAGKGKKIPKISRVQPAAACNLPPDPSPARASAMASARDLAVASISAAVGAAAAAAALRFLSSYGASSAKQRSPPTPCAEHLAVNGCAAERPPVQSPFDPAKREGLVLVAPPAHPL